MYIGNRQIGANVAPFIIAEMSGNHNQSLDRALQIVDAAAATGADAVKLQTYTPDTITLNIRTDDFKISDEKSLWKGRNLHDLYRDAHTPWEWHKPIMERARSHGMICFSSPFDETAVDFLEDLDVPAYKIASFENIHIPLLKKVASTRKPIIVSTGMASIAEIDEVVETVRENNGGDIVLLKCTSTYPATPKDSNILTIPHMKSLFRCEIGLSDHTMGVGVAVAAIAHGATVIEKHFTLSRAEGGVDSTFSLEPQEMTNLVVEAQRAWQSLGEISYGPTAAEEKSLAFRRSIYVAKDIAAGEILTHENLRIVRPAFGLAPKHYDLLIGRQAIRDTKAGTPATWGLIM
ncbi:pseudaminic acid synthase [Agrobacterium tumefaciens]|uniref:pseudaminic acid synthase n=1 Tax=Agrobacterium tumefaciens TaxID=358 RepID=UPI001572C329|nr:pseudaminic acid synthase [Agrobacterium tumefaciens]NSZ86817.1 pseudaminic acid synthase [Agrobacterium tumefaciens]WCA72000.1 pseudaminic acid synthase [Agrobacterium tumefaciens]